MTSKTFQDVIQSIQDSSSSTVEQGRRFEELTKAFLQQDPLYASQFTQVWEWGEWPGNQGRHDTGIDLVAENTDDSKFTAIQCKFYAPNHRISKADIDTFLSASGTNAFSRRMLVSSTNLWSRNAEDTLKDQRVPVARIGIDAFTKSSIDWSQYSIEQPTEITKTAPKAPRPHQQEAISAVLKNFQTQDRGQLIMACGTGKTYTALQIAEQQVQAGGTILFLAPSITLVSQSLREWSNDTTIPTRYHAVCSDANVGKSSVNADTNEIAAHDLISPATTNPETLVANVLSAKTSEHRTIIFSTYQSLDVIIAAQQQGLGEVDLIICDEAHRTTGVTLSGEGESEFTKVHHNRHIKAQKRLYMTATPRIFHPDSKSKAKDAKTLLTSMDDESVYGPEFYRLSFGDAVEQDLLCDYRVLIFGVNEEVVARNVQDIMSSEDNTLNLDDAAKIVASWNAISKQKSEYEDFGEDPEPMRRVVAFANRIDQSEQFTATFNATVTEYTQNQDIDIGLNYMSKHVDGRQNALIRANQIEWLKEVGDGNECHILSNARCLSEGVDVPALDAVLFLNPRASHIDVVQAVGRTMRKAPGKKYGYIIIPIAVTPDGDYAKSIRSTRYRATWQVLQALKSHDEDFYDAINQSDLKQSGKIKIAIFDDNKASAPDREQTRDEPEPNTQLVLPGMAEEIRNAVYARIVDSLTDKHYYRRWAEEVSQINEQYETRIAALLDADNTKLQADFTDFLNSLQRDLNDGITRQHAIAMLAQHLITKPIFDALFANYRFTAANPVSQAMERMTSRLEMEHGAESETKELQSFYKSVQRRIRYVEKAEDKQRVIADLYEDFFKAALPKTAASLGIVYTPVEAVDYIIRSVEDILQQEFSASMSDEGIHILDPFTGTGTFIQRTLASGLIQPNEMTRKYTQELHANEFILLAYYIAAINIETTYQEITQAQQYTPFEGIVLTDTFESSEYENAPRLSADFTRHNNARLERQKKQDIRVIIGNPPWSIGQQSENDDNKNRVYDSLRKRIRDTYAAKAVGKNQRSLYDTYIQAIRWASDRIADSPDGGIVAFITNGGFIDSDGGDGLRKSLLDEFTKVYCYNLRGNARTSGELRQREKDNVFGGGTQTRVAILILVKHPGTTGDDVVHYRDIGDYLSRENKLGILADSRLSATEWQSITPNEHGDWINQRSKDFDDLFPLYGTNGIFNRNIPGIVTGRDPWCYNFNENKIVHNSEAMVAFYNSQINATNPDTDSTKFSWTGDLLRKASKGVVLNHEPERVFTGVFRPFCKQNVYFAKNFNERGARQYPVYPEKNIHNLGIAVSEKSRNSLLSSLMTNSLPNYSLLGSTSQYLSRWTYRERNLLSKDPAEHYHKISNISATALSRFRRHYAEDAISEDDLFYYAYGVLHHQEYREKYAANLSKQSARIPMAESLNDFHKFVLAGRALSNLHLNYETAEPYPLTETWTTNAAPTAPDFYKVSKMRYGKQGRDNDQTVIIYNNNITLSNIPKEAYDYRIGQYPALRWLLERYQVKTDKPSGIINDPNDWCVEQNNPRYIVDLVKRVTAVSVKTMEIVQALPSLPV